MGEGAFQTRWLTSLGVKCSEAHTVPQSGATGFVGPKGYTVKKKNLNLQMQSEAFKQILRMRKILQHICKS